MQTFYLQIARYLQDRKMFNCCPSVVFVLFLASCFFSGNVNASVFPGSPDNFITTWRTGLSGATNAGQITFFAEGNYDIAVFPMNSTTPIQSFNNRTGTTTFAIGSPGMEFRIEVSGNLQKMNAYANGVDALHRGQLRKVTQWGNIAWTSFHNAFKGCVNLNVLASDIPNLSQPNINMESMFEDCSSLVGGGMASFNDWNTQNVTNMKNMFRNCSQFNLNIGSWNTQNVTDMSNMFNGAIVFNQAIGNWNTSNVTSMAYMFDGCSSFDKPLNNWNVSEVTNMSYMFNGCSSFDRPLNNWNVSEVTNMSYMFNGCSLFNQDLNSWDVSKVTNMSYMFYGATAFNGNISNWNTMLVTMMDRMFFGCTSFNQDLASWNTDQVTHMLYMFYNASSFNGNITNWNTINVENMQGMFQGATNFNQNIGAWNVNKVTNFKQMFQDATAFNQNIGAWNLNIVGTINMEKMFFGAISFNQELTNWNTLKVNNMASMFENATAFNQNIAHFNLSQNPTMNNMLASTSLDCENFSKILVGWNTLSGVTNMNLGSVAGLFYAPWAQAAYTSLTTTKGWTINGATFGNTGIISVNNMPNAGNLCVGMTVALSSTIPNHMWGLENNTIASLNTTDPNNATITALMSGTSKIYYTGGVAQGGCYSIYDLTVVAIPAELDASSNSPVCQGDIIQLFIQNANADQYAWMGPAGFTSTSKDTLLMNASPTMAGVYTAAMMVAGCTIIKEITVEIINAPIQPTGITGLNELCSHTSETYAVNTVPFATSYTWTYTGQGSLAGETNASVTFTPGSSGTISVIANNACGSSTAFNTDITVIEAANAGSLVGSSLLCLGNTSRLYPTGSLNGSVNWTSSEPDIVTVDQSGYVFGKASGSSVITYTVNGNAPCVNDVATFTVNVPPKPSVEIAFDSISHVFSLTTSAVTPSYQWVSCLSLTENELTGKIGIDFVPATEGLYAVIVTSDGCPTISECLPYNYGLITASIEDNQIELVSLSPNPATNTTTVSGLTSSTTISVTDSNGKTLFVQQVNDHSIVLPIDNLARGLYFIHIESITATGTKKLIKN